MKLEKNLIIKNNNKIKKVFAKHIVELINNNKYDSKYFGLFSWNENIVDFYKELVLLSKKKNISFNKLIAFNIFEYSDVEKYPDDSIRKLMNENLFNHMNINKSNVVFPSSHNIEKFNERIEEIEKFKFSILYVGKNGSIYNNEKIEEYRNNTVEIPLIENTFNDRFSRPEKAVVMSLSDIYEKSEKIILILSGEVEDKKESLMKFISGEKDINWPLTMFADHSNVTLFTDVELSKNEI